MYSEKIDTILAALEEYNKDLRTIALNIVNDILSHAKTEGAHTINVAYYTESEVCSWNFLGIDGNGYGSALFISDIDLVGGKPLFNMVNEDGDSFEERTLFDFDTTELTYLVRMLNDILNVVIDDDDVRCYMDWI